MQANLEKMRSCPVSQKQQPVDKSKCTMSPPKFRSATIRSAFGSIATATDDEADVEQQGNARAPESGEIRELDRYRDTVLALPPLRHSRLRVLSTQDMRYVDGVGRDGRVNGYGNRLRITDPEGFWEGGRYLVLLVER